MLEKGETIQSYYMRFAKLMNDFDIIGLGMRRLQVNTKFVYHLHPEWSRTRFPDPLALVEKTYNPPSSYASHSSHYNQHLPTSPDSGFAILTFLPIDDLLASLNKALMFHSTYFTSRYPSTNNQLRTSPNLRTQANIQDGKVTVQNVQGRQSEGHYAKQCTVKKQVKDSEWFKEKILLAQKQEAGIELDAEQQDFMVDGLEAFNLDCENL
ncbi:hypothetical protein Tco_0185069 [Tanacetum coccineum]